MFIQLYDYDDEERDGGVAATTNYIRRSTMSFHFRHLIPAAPSFFAATTRAPLNCCRLVHRERRKHFLSVYCIMYMYKSWR